MTAAPPQPTAVTRHVVSALVLDRPGTLNRVSSLLRARSFNIDSLTVGSTHEPGLSRMTIVIRGDAAHTRQVVAQLERLIEVVEVSDLTDTPRVELELALVEVAPPTTAKARATLQRAIGLAAGELLTKAPDAWRLRLTAAPAQVERALEALRGIGLRSLVRAGSVAMAAGSASEPSISAPQPGEISA
jgi:acetolactate synthase-1/3 small subunit